MSTEQPNHRWAAGFLAAAIVPLAFLLDTAVAMARGWSPGTPLNSLLIKFFVAVLAVSGVTLLVPSVRRFYGRRATQLWVALAALLVLALVAELAAAALLPDPERTVFH